MSVYCIRVYCMSVYLVQWTRYLAHPRRAAQYAKPPDKAQRPRANVQRRKFSAPLPPSRRGISTLCTEVPPDPSPPSSRRVRGTTPTPQLFLLPYFRRAKWGAPPNSPAGPRPPQGLCGRGRNSFAQTGSGRPPPVSRAYWKYPVHHVPRERSRRGRALSPFFCPSPSFPIFSPYLGVSSATWRPSDTMTHVPHLPRFITPLLYYTASLLWDGCISAGGFPSHPRLSVRRGPLVSGTIELFPRFSVFPPSLMGGAPPALGTPAWACHETRTSPPGNQSLSSDPTQTPPFLVVYATRQTATSGGMKKKNS